MSSFKNKQGANKKSRLTINFTQMYDSVRLVIPVNWEGLLEFPISLQHARLVFCYAHARAVYLRLHLLLNFY